MTRNKYIEKLLASSNKIYKDFKCPKLSLSQIEWRLENSETVLGVIGKRTFGNYKFLVLNKCKNGSYVLFTERSKKDPYGYYYTISDIDEFIKRYPVRVLFEKDSEQFDFFYYEVDKHKEGQPAGLIEARVNETTMIIETMKGE